MPYSRKPCGRASAVHLTGRKKAVISHRRTSSNLSAHMWSVCNHSLLTDGFCWAYRRIELRGPGPGWYKWGLWFVTPLVPISDLEAPTQWGQMAESCMAGLKEQSNGKWIFCRDFSSRIDTESRSSGRGFYFRSGFCYVTTLGTRLVILLSKTLQLFGRYRKREDDGKLWEKCGLPSIQQAQQSKWWQCGHSSVSFIWYSSISFHLLAVFDSDYVS